MKIGDTKKMISPLALLDWNDTQLKSINSNSRQAKQILGLSLAPFSII